MGVVFSSKFVALNIYIRMYNEKPTFEQKLSLRGIITRPIEQD